jgi:hypothetical protein
MQLNDSTYISYGGTPAKEAWLNGTLVWKLSSYGWIEKNLATGPWSEVVYGPTNTLVVAGFNRYSYSTDNGNTWATPINPINPAVGSEFYNAIAWGNNIWVMLETQFASISGTINYYTSVDILTGWTVGTISPAVTSLETSDCQYSSYHGRYIAIGSKNGRYTNQLCGMYSADGVNWLSAGFLVNSVPNSNNQGYTGNLAEGSQMPNHRLVACGSAGDHKFGYSNDGGSLWNRGNYAVGNSPLGQNLQTGHAWTQVAYGYDGSVNLPLSGRYVAVCGSGSTSTFQFAYSNDGIGWYGVSYTSPNLKRNWNSVTYNNGYFVAIDVNYQAMSKDGISWVAFANVPTTVAISDVTVANNRFVGVKNNQAGGNNAIVADFF